MDAYNFGLFYCILELQPDEERLFLKILFFDISRKPVPWYPAFQALFQVH